MNSYNRKDCSPDETIKHIKNILEKNNIKVKESEIINIDNSIFSVRVELKNISGVGTNGKGISRELALASAYAEFMERLQSKFLVKSNFLNKEITKSFKDEYYLEYEEFVKKFSKVKGNYYIKKLVENNSSYRYYTKFYDVLNDKYIELPIKLINLLTHSNGLCSGNSKEEALVQGICEILERHCYKEILLKENYMPNIVVNNLEKVEVYNQLMELKKLGLEYEIKDCSLNGKFPVVGLVIYDKNRENYIFTIGSDPDFNIALQRCITEAFQGLKTDEIMNKMKPVKNSYYNMKKIYGKDFLQDNWLKCYSSNTGIHPSSFFNNRSEINLERLPFYTVKNNKKALEFILNILQKYNLSVYIKDYSYLGFDTYKIYIPTLSEVDEIDPLSFEISSNMETLRNTYFNIYKTKYNSNEVFEKVFLHLAKSIKYNKFILPSNIFNVNDYIQCDYLKLNYLYVLIVELLLTKQYDKIISVIDYQLENYEVTDYEKEYLLSIKSEVNTVGSKRIKQKSVFAKDASFLVNHTERYLNKLKAPTCPDCKKCRCKMRCKYKEWKIINELVYRNS